MFLYATWLNGISLVEEIKLFCKDLQFCEVDLYKLANCEKLDRKGVVRLAESQPNIWKAKINEFIKEQAQSIDGAFVTQDWHPVFRIFIECCKEQGITTLLIPHESVFVDLEKWYWDKKTGNNIPITDFVLVWGELQKKIFKERGFSGTIIKIGSIKLDRYVNYKPNMSFNKFCSTLSLKENKSILLFCLQLMDTQWGNQTIALEKQQQAILDLIEFCKNTNYQLLLRFPQAQATKILPQKFLDSLLDFVALDGYGDEMSWLVSPEDAIFYSDMILSFNSTMLLEASIANKPAIVLRYFDFKSLWIEKGCLPAVKNLEDIKFVIPKYLGNGRSMNSKGYTWAKNQFSSGEFDGKSLNMVREFLINQLEY